MDGSGFRLAHISDRKPDVAGSAAPGNAPRRRGAVGCAAAGVILLAGLTAGCASGGGGGGASGPLTICEIAATSGPFAQLGDNDELGATA